MEKSETHSTLVGYVLWLMGWMGAHRFYLGKPISGIIWLFTGGLFLVGWLVDIFLIPSMVKDNQARFTAGRYDYSIGWLLLAFGGVFGFHRFYIGKMGTGILFLCTFGLFGFGLLYDYVTFTGEIDRMNRRGDLALSC